MTYTLTRLSDEPDAKRLWGIKHDACGGNVVRRGLRDAFYWVEVHEQLLDEGRITCGTSKPRGAGE